MHITGERRIPAPRERLWRSLADASVLQACLPEARIEGDDAGGLRISGLDGAAPVHARPSIREPFSTLGWRLDAAGPATQHVLFRLVEQGVFTLLHYELSVIDPDGGDARVRETAAQARIDQALERLVQTVSGPAEIGAGGIATGIQAATEPSAQPNASLRSLSGGGGAAVLENLMTPSVIGGVLFLVVLLFVLGLF